MIGLFLRPDADDLIAASTADPVVKDHALEVLQKGYTVIRRCVPEVACLEAVTAFRRLERSNEEIFGANRDANGHYPRIVNLHSLVPELLSLFTISTVSLNVQDLLYGGPTALYTTLFYETGSQQPLHRDTPVFATRPEYLYFGTTIYLEGAGRENGCLEVMEGGHRIPEPDRETMALRRYASLERIPDFDNDLWVEYQDAVAREGFRRGLRITGVTVEAGDCIIWHPQLPHGGSPIEDIRRTRFSLVMHTTPVGVPVYHHDAFFHPSRPFSERAAWTYRLSDGRKIADMGRSISFGHTKEYPMDCFRNL